ncbi:MAG: histidine phosphatase family protein [Phycisphaeraceae bacterium]|nr:histidine phosphatase family protein [Phycisphaeraceae bacterium]
MRLFVIRHGKARKDSDSGLDEDRDLTPRGERQAAYLASILARHPSAPRTVISSPAVRARRTAEPIADALGVELRLDDALRVDEPPSPVLDLIADEPNSIALVGHLPQLGRLLAILLDGSSTGERELRTGMCVEIEIGDSGPARRIAVHRLAD